MKVIFSSDAEESDVYDVPDHLSEDELYEMANNWVANNVAGWWKKVDENEIQNRR